ncbi:prepilin peptidase [Phenylobacterium aquaticum]|uniref:A24 family peptidase n=1 Tax=Phenylobacterium aquaticum TaxID=1763816 RepID=UPI0026EF8183|nr:prepilin peptidase [Phenylobacterium aquaticum]
MIALFQTLLLSTFPALVIVAGMRDVTSYTIPNWISLALIAAFVPAALAGGLTLPAIGLQLAFGVVALVAGMAMFALGWIGGGDAKLFAAVGLWLGWPASITYLLVTGVTGGALAVGLLSLRSLWMRPYVQGGPPWFGRLATPGENVPYGFAIAAGALTAFPASALGLALMGLG